MVWPGTGITCSQGVPMVLSTTCECGAAPSTSQAVSPPLYLSAPSLPLPHQVLSACLPVSVPPAHLGEYNFFKALVVRLLYSSGCFGGCFSGSSWCFSSLSQLYSFLWLCKEAKHVYHAFTLTGSLGKYVSCSSVYYYFDKISVTNHNISVKCVLLCSFVCQGNALRVIH